MKGARASRQDSRDCVKSRLQTEIRAFLVLLFFRVHPKAVYFEKKVVFRHQYSMSDQSKRRASSTLFHPSSQTGGQPLSSISVKLTANNSIV